MVSGAGNAQVDGLYTRSGVHDGAPMYTKDNLAIYRDRGNWCVQSAKCKVTCTFLIRSLTCILFSLSLSD